MGHDVILVIVNKIQDHIGYFQTSLLIIFSLTEILLGNDRQLEKNKIKVDPIDVVDEGNRQCWWQRQ